MLSIYVGCIGHSSKIVTYLTIQASNSHIYVIHAELALELIPKSMLVRATAPDFVYQLDWRYLAIQSLTNITLRG